MSSLDQKSMSSSEVLTISISSGVVIGMLMLCLTNNLSLLFGVEQDYGVKSLAVRCGIGGAISLLAIFPMVAIGQVRRDLVSFILCGPQIGLWVVVTFYVFGTQRFYNEFVPDFVWPAFGIYIICAIVLNVAVFYTLRRKS